MTEDKVKELILKAFLYGAFTAQRSDEMSDEYLKNEANECVIKLMNS